MTRRDAWVVTGLALAARLGVVAWAGSSIPPAADGTYYHLLAERIASGQGYTWLWPDGVVTHAAHYPVGYPALIAAAYAAFGAKPVTAMLVNALLGTAGAWAVHDLLRRATTRKLAMAGGIVAALHPALVPYTAAIMTEGVAAGLVAVAAALADRAGARRRAAWVWLVASGAVMGVATLVRPQVIVLAPVLGLLAARESLRARLRGAVMVTAIAAAVCAPWTVRNCVRMDRCAMVSVNGGWNLAIGTQTTGGGWQEIAVPEACKEVFAEAAKDECFGRAARGAIAAAPLAWLLRIPAKLRVTFDYFGAAPWYLHAANAARFPYPAKVALGVLETVASRVLLLAALVTVRKLEGPRRLAREAVTAVGLVACFLTAGTVGYLACVVAVALLGVRELARGPRLVPVTAAVVLATAVLHAVFFGAGRYGLMVAPFVAALGFVRPPARASATNPSHAGGANEEPA